MPPARTYPGVHSEKRTNGIRTIEGVPTSIAAFVGWTLRGPSNVPWTVNSYSEYESNFGDLDRAHALAHAVDDFFMNGGNQALIVRASKEDGSPTGLPPDESSYRAAFDALGKADIFNFLCVPPYDTTGDIDPVVLQNALQLCVERRALLIVDPRSNWFVPNDVLDSRKGLAALGLNGMPAENAAVYFPRVKKANSTIVGQTETLVPCGAVAGVMARNRCAAGCMEGCGRAGGHS